MGERKYGCRAAVVAQGFWRPAKRRTPLLVVIAAAAIVGVGSIAGMAGGDATQLADPGSGCCGGH